MIRISSSLRKKNDKLSAKILLEATPNEFPLLQDLETVLRQDFEAQESTKTQKTAKTVPARQPMEGQILKFTNVVKGYQYRWFVLNPDSGMLEYFEKEEHKKLRPRGSVHLAAAVVSPSEEDSQTFIVSAANGEIFKLRALDAKERQLWVDRIRSTAEYHTANIAQVQNSSYPAQKVPSVVPVRHTDSVRRTPGSHESLPVVRKSPREDMLQEVREYYTEADDFAKHLDQRISELPPSGHYLNSLDPDLLLLKATSTATLQCIQACISILQLAEPGAKQTPSSRNIESIALPKAMKVSPAMLDVPAGSLPNPEDEVPDEDTYQDKDLEGVEEHKSVILHLLSQLKLGMDLTKVVLPTFILERRSLLEMFADCMAHPDAFLKIPKIPDPEGRFLAVLEWYLTSFHNGRPGSIAKKPYNPIIGETFHCSWHVSEPTDSVLTYTAEQVSHHPPVSAFYFECPHSRMKMNASIYTKSKFMGMSIGVSMIGKVHLHLEDHGEDYVFGLPSAYARSILTVPWVELGDKVVLVCEKTGYSAHIIFHTKPFYGGKLHHVTAEAKNVRTSDVLCKVTGEWNSGFEFTYHTSTSASSKFVDVKSLPVYRKYVRPLDKQKEYESRKLWYHVTNALKMNDVITATEHKQMLEEIQREDEKRRHNLGVEYTPKYFKKIDGGVWLYKTLPDDFAHEAKK